MRWKAYRGHIKRKQDVQGAVKFALELAKQFGLKDITANRQSPLKFRIIIGVSERYHGKGVLVLATNDNTQFCDFMTAYTHRLWVERKIMNEWKL